MMTNSIARAGVLLAVASVGLAIITPEAFVDEVLKDFRTETSTVNFDPNEADPFDVNVTDSGRDIRARFTHGKIVGIKKLHRLGRCKNETLRSEVKIGCAVSMSSIRIMMNAEVQEVGAYDKRLIATETRMTGNPTAWIEFTGKPGDHARVETFTPPTISLSSDIVQGSVRLGGSYPEFKRQLNEHVANQLLWFWNIGYPHALDLISFGFRMPQL